MELPEFEVSATVDREASDLVAPEKPALAPTTPLRHALDELQRVAESAVASAVESDLNAAMSQAAKTLENFDRARPPVELKSAAAAESHAVPALAGRRAGDASLQFARAPKVLPRLCAGENDVPVLSLCFDSSFASSLGSSFSYFQRGFRRGIWPAAICACLLFFASLFAILAIVRIHARPAMSTPQYAAAASSYDADPRDVAEGQVLTVMAGPQQTLRELSLLYVGRFDSELFKEICALNPELKDPNHIEAGQLVRIRLPQGTLKKVTDTAEISNASKAKDPAGFVARMVHWLGGD